MLSHETPPEPGALFSAIRFAGQNSVVAAVSGGGDSLALLFLLHDHLKTIHNAPSLVAVTVDHALRAESAEEARAVGRIVAKHGIAHRVLSWNGPKPATGISVAAREARLSLLARAAAEVGAGLVFTGHTADDQAETLAMRLARGEGRGVAGIAPATLYDGFGSGIWFVRPLLETRRETLRAFLRGRGIRWIDDPTNEDRRFERARLRQDLDEGAVSQLLTRSREAAREREEAGRGAAALIETAQKVAPGLFRLPLATLEEAQPGVCVYALRILLAVAGGTQHLPDEARTAAVLARLRQEGARTSLSRAVAASRRGHIHIHRERRNLPSLPLENGLIWDGRYRIAVDGKPRDVLVACLGAQGAREAEIAGAAGPPGLIRSALSAEPALWEGVRCLGLAAGSEDVSLHPVAAPWARLLPSFDLAPAQAVTELLGGVGLPSLPWLGHKGSVR